MSATNPAFNYDGPDLDEPEPDQWPRISKEKIVNEDGSVSQITTIDSGSDYHDEIKTTEKIFKDGKLIVTHTTFYVRGDEGSYHEEEWLNAASQRHREDGPAYTTYSSHYIPEETYLDDSREEFWKDGVLVDSIDRT